MRSFAIDHTPAAAYTAIAVDSDNPFEVMYGIAIALNAVSAQILISVLPSSKFKWPKNFGQKYPENAHSIGQNIQNMQARLNIPTWQFFRIQKWKDSKPRYYLDAAHIASRPPTIGQWSNFLQNGTFSISLWFIFKFSAPEFKFVVFRQLVIFTNKKFWKFDFKVFLSFKIQWHEFYWLVIPYVLIV